jgi:hypothetical protein
VHIGHGPRKVIGIAASVKSKRTPGAGSSTSEESKSDQVCKVAPLHGFGADVEFRGGEANEQVETLDEKAKRHGGDSSADPS